MLCMWGFFWWHQLSAGTPSVGNANSARVDKIDKLDKITRT